mmetsp:Transcript_15729/g.26531  ORF Transcript_15729/g.26531 Transcript_15729/m.26531 type:complete len:413 (-) Transcript_15729:94-1332(-)
MREKYGEPEHLGGPPHEHHGHHGHHGHHDKRQLHGMDKPRFHDDFEGPGPKPDAVVSREEFILYDIIKSLSFFVFLASFLLLILGKVGLKVANKQKTMMSRRVLRKSKGVLLLLVFFSLIVLKYAHEFKHVVRRIRDDSKTEMPHLDKKPMHAEHEHEMRPRKEEPEQRNLRSKHFFPQSFRKSEEVEEKPVPMTQISEPKNFLKMPSGEQCEGQIDQNSCDALASCSWCKSAAVRPACRNLEDAKKLPPAVFQCDKLEETKVEDEENHGKQDYYYMGVKLHTGRWEQKEKHGHKKHGHCCVVPLLFPLLLVVHFFNLKKMNVALETQDSINGVTPKKCGKGKKAQKNKVVEQEQTASLLNEASPDLNYSLCEHSDLDKQEYSEPSFQVASPVVENQNAVSYSINATQNQMV